MINPVTSIKIISVSMANIMNNKPKNSKNDLPKQFVNKILVVK